SGAGEARLYNGAPHSGRAQWWGNAADNMESTLTREFDLTGVDHATLNFSTWYDTERDYDYAYVAVSTDQGCTWQTLPGQHNTDALDWAVQAIAFSDTGTQVLQVPVRRTPAAPGGDATTIAGTLTIPQFGTNVNRVVVAISPLIPVTLVPADFTLDATVR